MSKVDVVHYFVLPGHQGLGEIDYAVVQVLVAPRALYRSVVQTANAEPLLTCVFCAHRLHTVVTSTQARIKSALASSGINLYLRVRRIWEKCNRV